MKLYTFFTISILSFVFFGCEKIPFDSRNKYVGDYNFEYSYSSWQLNLGIYASDTINYSGKVYYSHKDKIILNYNTNTELELGIEKNGNLRLECGTTVGKFENDDNVIINYSSNSCGGGGLGGGTNYRIIGRKK